MKQELLKKLEHKNLNEIESFLPGNDYIRGYCGNINGYYTNGYYDNIDIVDKQGLTLTFKIDKDSFEESEELFENTQQYEDGTDFKDWNGEWSKTLDNYCSIIFLTYLLKL